MAAEEIPAASISKWTGLYRSVDPFAIAPGALSRADNVVVPGPSLLRPRRGFLAGRGGPAPAPFSKIVYPTLGFFAGYAVFLDDSTVTTDYQAQNVASATNSVDVGRGASTFDLTPATLAAYSFNVPAATTKTRWFTGNGNLYTTTSYGLARTDVTPAVGFGNTFWKPALMDTPVVLTNFALSGSGTFLADQSECAYRLTYRYRDANGNDHRGPPSPKMVVLNKSGSAKGVTVVAAPSSAVLPGTVIETWRTTTVAIPSDGSDGTGDEMFKVDERVVSGANIVTGADGYLTVNLASTPFLSFLDNTPNVPFLVEPLYTNPTTGQINGLGIANANQPPPVAADVFTFKGRTYYCNTQEVERLTVQIIGTGTGGIVNGDTFTLGGATFMFLESGTVPGGVTAVQLWRTGGPFDAGSIVENIRNTAAGAAQAINTALGPLSFYFNSVAPVALNLQIRASSAIVNGLPGYVNLARLVPGASSFTIAAGVGGGRGWAGSLATNNTSDSNRQPANLCQSQADDPESVPPAFTNTVGRLDRPLLRGLGLRDAAYLFKDGDGLWKFTDDGTGDIVIGPVDQTVELVAPETAVSLDNAIYCLSDKGVLRITDGGSPENVSNDKIEDDLFRLMAYVGPSTLANVAFAVAYESDRMYVLCLPESPNATTCTIQYVFNLDTQAWTRWTLPFLTCGGVDPTNDRLVFGRDSRQDGRNSLWVERKAQSSDDQQDPGFTGTVPGVGTYSAAALVFSGDVTGSYAAGDLIRYTSGATSTLARVTSDTWAVGSNQTTVTLDRTVTWTAGESFTLIRGIQANVELLPLTDGEPLYEKQWQNVYLYFRRAEFTGGDLSFSTEKQQTPVTYSLGGPTALGWIYDDLGFGNLPWGGAAQNVILERALDQAAARSAELTLGIRIGDALASWELSALRIPYQPTTRRVTRS